MSDAEESNKRPRVEEAAENAAVEETTETNAEETSTTETAEEPSSKKAKADGEEATTSETPATEESWQQEREKMTAQIAQLQSTVSSLGGSENVGALGAVPDTTPVEGDEESIKVRCSLTGLGPRKIIECPNPKVGLIIGKNGSTFRQIQEETGAQLYIPDESAPGSSFREITIQGEAFQVARCESLILSRISGRGWAIMPSVQPVVPQVPAGGYSMAPAMAPARTMIAPPRGPGEEVESYVFSVPNEVVGIIIGRGGATFRQLQEESGCMINIPKDAAPGSPYREITLKGSRLQIEACHTSIMRRIEPAMQKMNSGVSLGAATSQTQQQQAAAYQQAWTQQQAAAYQQQGYAAQGYAQQGQYDANAQQQQQQQYMYSQ